MKDRSKFLIFSLIVVVLIVTVLGAYIFYKNRDDNYYIKLDNISGNIDSIKLGGKTYTLYVKNDMLGSYIQFNDIKIENQAGFISFFAIMNKKYLLVGKEALGTELVLYDKNLNEIENFYTGEGSVYKIINNTTFSYENCDYESSNYRKYEVSFKKETYEKKVIEEEKVDYCGVGPK